MALRCSSLTFGAHVVVNVSEWKDAAAWYGRFFKEGPVEVVFVTISVFKIMCVV